MCLPNPFGPFLMIQALFHNGVKVTSGTLITLDYILCFKKMLLFRTLYTK